MLREHHMVVVDDVEGSRKAVARIAEAGATDLILQAQVAASPTSTSCASMSCSWTRCMRMTAWLAG